ncbi:MAG: hypothetical protein AAF196_14075 [Planctomycetota bacterium]
MSEESIEARKRNRKELEAEALTTGKGGLALAGGLLVALGCAALWAVLIVYMGVQYGLLAWVIGSVVGGMIASLGGRGLGMSIAAAFLSLIAIFGGQYGAIVWRIQDQPVEEILTDGATRKAYGNALDRADEFENIDVDSDEDVRLFLADFDPKGREPAEFSDAEIRTFRIEVAPRLKAFAESPPSREEWRATEAERIRSQRDATELFVESLDWFDLLFAALGVGTAFAVVQRMTSQALGAARRRRSQARRGAS